MRRQLKLQSQLTRPYANRDNDETPEKASRSLNCDGEHGDRRRGGEDSYPWSAVSMCGKSAGTRRSGRWERPQGPEGPSSEELRSCSIAKLRAKAREHEAEIHGTVNTTGGDTPSQAQEADATHSDWSFSFFLFVQIIIVKEPYIITVPRHTLKKNHTTFFETRSFI